MGTSAQKLFHINPVNMQVDAFLRNPSPSFVLNYVNKYSSEYMENEKKLL